MKIRLTLVALLALLQNASCSAGGLTGTPFAGQHTMDPQSVGSVVTSDFMARNERPHYFALGYGFRSGDRQDVERVYKLSGRNGRDPKTGALQEPGISLPIEITIVADTLPNQPVVFYMRVDEEEQYALIQGPNNYMFVLKRIAVTSLKPGHYRVTVKVMRAVPELTGTPVIFTHSVPIR